VDRGRFDAIVVGGGHNGLVAATLLGRAGLSVLVLERDEHVGGATVSAEVFPGARISRYAYLVSLFPAWLMRDLGVGVKLRRREVSWYAPGVPNEGAGDRGFERLQAMLAGVAGVVFPTLTEPLRSRESFRELIGEPWEALFERPLSELLETTTSDDVVRGVALTDATIGTFTPADDPELRQNRCFLYHVVGGSWDVPVGGMGAISAGLERAARQAGAEIRTQAEVTGVEADEDEVVVSCATGNRYAASHLLAGVAPAVLDALMGRQSQAPEGSQLKINLLLRRLPRLRDSAVSPERAFTGTFHVNEGYQQLQRAYEEAAAGRIPTLPPCEMYCHSLTDPSVLSPEFRARGAQTLTLFGLHMPARLFAGGAKQAAVNATLASVNSALAEPLEDCLALDAGGAPCLEAHTPLDLEAELAMPGGHIFHRDLSWPFAESDDEVGTWGVETDYPNVWLCGAGARRGGCVSGIPGHNAARAVLGASLRRPPAAAAGPSRPPRANP
jgi:phytoene dehydrogenase-like protein